MFAADKFVPALKVEGEVININVPYSMMKLKSMLIGAFGEVDSWIRYTDGQKHKTNRTLFCKTDVFKLNRRLRNNLHYKEVDKLSVKELGKLMFFKENIWKLY